MLLYRSRCGRHSRDRLSNPGIVIYMTERFSVPALEGEAPQRVKPHFRPTDSVFPPLLARSMGSLHLQGHGKVQAWVPSTSIEVRVVHQEAIEERVPGYSILKLRSMLWAVVSRIPVDEEHRYLRTQWLGS